MKLEVGKKYKTRDNQIVTITQYDAKSPTEYTMKGEIEIDKSICHRWWNEDGSFDTLTHDLDIMEEVATLLPFDPTKKAEVTTETGEAVSLLSNEPDSNGRFCALVITTNTFRLLTKEQLRIKPLTTIDGKPVFIGDEIVVFGVSANIERYDSKTETIQTQQQVSIIGITGVFDEFLISQVSLPKKLKYVNLYRTNKLDVDIEGHWHDSEKAAMRAVVNGDDYIGTIIIDTMNTSKEREYVKLY